MGEIFVARPDLPPLEDYVRLLEEVWQSRQLTNHGPLHRRLQEELALRLGAPHLRLVSNGTVAIQIALRALQIHGKVVTTPFTFPATANALVWEGLEPAFCDVDLTTFNIDPAAVEEALEGASAILAVHVYGNPCAVDELARIGKRHGIPVLYDAAHAFGVEYRGRPILSWGDGATLSFHATKIFHTGEGGAVIMRNETLAEQVHLLQNNGIRSEVDFMLAGTNAKMSELHAAMGLANLPYHEERVKRRAEIEIAYREGLAGTAVEWQRQIASTPNHAYLPILLKDEATREGVAAALRKEGIFPRRYFYPLASEARYFARPAETPVALSLSRRVLCLPMYADLALADVLRVVKIVRATV